MKYWINNGYANEYVMGDYVKPLSISGDVILVIDPSKTNMACLIGSPLGEIYSIVEFSGNNRKAGPAGDTTAYCSDVRSFLTQYLSKCKVYDAGVEKAITKKGFEHHISSMVLNEIRGMLLSLLQEVYGFRNQQVEVNNYSWKSSVLPEGYRGHGEKGSKRFFMERFPGSPLCAYFEADATDVVCMYWHIIKRYKGNYQIACNKEESPMNTCNIGLYPPYMDNMQKTTKFIFNTHFGVENNSYYFSNRSANTGITPVKVETLTVEEIYKYACGFSNLEEIPEEVRLVVTR